MSAKKIASDGIMQQRVNAEIQDNLDEDLTEVLGVAGFGAGLGIT